MEDIATDIVDAGKHAIIPLLIAALIGKASAATRLRTLARRFGKAHAHAININMYHEQAAQKLEKLMRNAYAKSRRDTIQREAWASDITFPDVRIPAPTVEDMMHYWDKPVSVITSTGNKLKLTGYGHYAPYKVIRKQAQKVWDNALKEIQNGKEGQNVLVTLYTPKYKQLGEATKYHRFWADDRKWEFKFLDWYKDRRKKVSIEALIDALAGGGVTLGLQEGVLFGSKYLPKSSPKPDKTPEIPKNVDVPTEDIDIQKDIGMPQEVNIPNSMVDNAPLITAHHVVGGLTGAGSVGLLSALLTKKKEGETEQELSKRRMNNALIGALVGGGIGTVGAEFYRQFKS